MQPLDRETHPEVRLTVQCNVTRTQIDDVRRIENKVKQIEGDEEKVGDTEPCRPEVIRHFWKQIIIQVLDVNDQVINCRISSNIDFKVFLLVQTTGLFLFLLHFTHTHG